MNSLHIDKAPRDTRVVVAMSGGVDSSATAAMLAREGYDVVGVTLQLYDHGQATDRPGSCCAGRDIHDARRVAAAIGIPHYVLDYEDRFRESVVEDFADSYLRGETPIPCVRCNQTVKFTDLLDTARDLGGDALVTGHYVRWRPGPAGPELWRGADHGRDQSYFLFATTAAQLAFLRFPLGALDKDRTRALAREFDLPVAEKADSQDICFVPQGRYADVVARLRPQAQQPGQIVDLDGRILGRHDGLVHFTVGQRRGIGIAAAEPLYVVRLEPEARRVVVGPRSALLRDRLRIGGVNWLAPAESGAIRAAVKLRSMQDPAPATVHLDGAGGARVVLDEPVAGIAPGQACVCYDGERVLGGGWILRDDPADPARG
ncbi:MAG: tRNA 2-thiouridine(34) synthase MnmA [Hyphomicrobiales bacterium]|nr:tRNA 2-thiouridine(34) synthase MnmA [Hyphomicrobiales bacterium]MCP5372509.1 tRNA 2-thiouridine(34) synthase MnmA [Hyphomicrobiales bacterium]